MASKHTVFGAVVNDGSHEFGHIDPVVRIVIDNGFHEYEFGPEEIQKIIVHPLAALAEETER